MTYERITSCRSCGASNLETVFEFGEVPLADQLLRPDEIPAGDLLVPMTLLRCQDCTLLQIAETVSPRVLFGADYPYFSSVSMGLRDHFRRSATDLIDHIDLPPSSLVVEAASNDGCMLRHFVGRDLVVVGIDPAPGPARAARQLGIETIEDFFGVGLATRVRASRGPARLFLANNVLAHVPDPNDFVAGIRTMIEPDGMAVIEVPWLVDLIEGTEFDTIYHEHFCYFSVTALTLLLGRHGLALKEIVHTDIHGGSLRLFIGVGNDNDGTPSVANQLAQERRIGVADHSYYRAFANRVVELRRNLCTLLVNLKREGASIAAYGAAAKAATLLGYCDIGNDLIDFVADRNPAKHGLYMGGNHLPITAPEAVTERRPDYLLLTAWNFADEIIAEQRQYAASGGRFIVPIPRPVIRWG